MRIGFIIKTTLAFAAIMGAMTAGFVLLFPFEQGLASVQTAEASVLSAAEPVDEPEASDKAEMPLFSLENIFKTESFALPIDKAADRVLKKPFGIEIHPETSPVENDRFDGYHVGVDFEAFLDEAGIDVPIYAICDGPLRFKQWAKGYGGVAVQACVIETEVVSVIYGHLDLASVIPAHGEMIAAGERIAVLGEGETEETDGVRKHLHLGIRKGVTNDIRGYVKDQDEFTLWLDARKVLGLDSDTF